jgi:ubiquinol-cytochrome c reductase iron-sulfur subunit
VTGAERMVAALLGLASALFVAFVVVLLADPNTQLLGVTLGGGLALLAAALVVASKRLVPQAPAIEPRPNLEDPQAREEVRARLVPDLSRRKLLTASAAAAGTALTAAIVAPLTALGPAVGDSIVDTPWKLGRRLVDEAGKPLTVDDVAPGSFVTAFPEGADKRELGSPVVLVRDDPARLRLPPERKDWAPQGVLAFSKICTHAGCAIALYRKPTYEPTSAAPALACPCHYSVFATRQGGAVEAGPAGRPLPQLPLRIGPNNELQAAGGFSGPIGPAWWSVRS